MPKMRSRNREGVKFCSECAAPLSAKCPNCGSINQPGAKFCDECGAQIAAEISKSPTPESSFPSARVTGVQPEAQAGLEGSARR
jgi:phage FluMu protein Com